jgi:hypothetical protein
MKWKDVTIGRFIEATEVLNGEFDDALDKEIAQPWRQP